MEGVELCISQGLPNLWTRLVKKICTPAGPHMVGRVSYGRLTNQGQEKNLLAESN